jgi:transcriptional regulator
MYLPSHFENADEGQLLDAIAAYPFGSLVVEGPQGLDADHIPFFVDRREAEPPRLIAHVARANPLWKQARPGQDVLAIFRADDAYVSPNWYPGKHEHHRLVPTWNYRIVHVHGRLHIHDDQRFVHRVVARLTKFHEARTGSDRPWKMTDSTPEFIDQMLANIVGLEVEIVRMVGKWKLSQNRDRRDLENAAKELRDRGETSLADAMLATLEKS